MAKYSTVTRKQSFKKNEQAKVSNGRVGRQEADTPRETLVLERTLIAGQETNAHQLYNPALTAVQRQTLAQQVG